MNSPAMTETQIDESSGGRLVSTDGRSLPLAGVRLAADARGGIARVVLEQRFRNPHPEPLQVTYAFPLPHDAAVSGFAFRLGERRVVGEVDRLAAARERFERALLEGRTAARVDEERGSLFTQELGNVPPGAEIVAELTLDQRLLWVPEGAWEWRFPTAVAPRYLGAPGRVADAARATVDVADGAIDARLHVAFATRDALAAGGRPESPSHAMRFAPAGAAVRGALADAGGAPLDRDVVVRWPVATDEVGLTVDGHRAPAGGPLHGRAFAVLAATPPRRAPAAIPRDLVVLLDTSGSMAGEPLAQARRVVGALVESLAPADRLELVAFASEPVRWRSAPAEATAAARADALAWLAALEAGGATEMHRAILEALRPLRTDSQRQVVLVTDGLVGFEAEIVASVLRDLPPGSRLHAVGVGSAVNRSLTGPAARAGRGREVIVGVGEDPERAARTLRAHTAAPVVTELAVSGDALVAHAPSRLPDLYAGAPALVALEVRPEGGSVTLRGRTRDGAFERSARVPALEPGAGNPAAAALFAREAVEDLEMRAAAAGAPALDFELEQLGLAFQISTRLTSWVAVSEEPTTDPRAPFRRERMPQALPHGMSVEGLGLRAPSRGLVNGLVACSATVFKCVDRSPPANAATDYLDVPAELRAIGRVTSDDGELVIVEVIPVVARELRWDPPATVDVDFGRRGSGVFEVDERTTRAGTIAAGQSIRLVLRRPPGSRRWRLRAVALRSGEDDILVKLMDGLR